MITKVKINNFKSVQDNTLNLGRFNVFIGENGCGKSNLLEAICYASAARTKRMDNSVLLAKGVRVVPENITRSAFENDGLLTFSVEIHDVKRWVKYEFAHDENPFSSWKSNHITDESGAWYPKEFVNDFSDFLFKGKPMLKDYKNEEYGMEIGAINQDKLEEIRKAFESFIKSKKRWATKDKLELTNNILGLIHSRDAVFIFQELVDFTIYSPENSSLRLFEEEDLNRPLGSKGQGVFKLVKAFDSEKIQELKTLMNLIDWFEDFNIPQELFATEARLTIKDRFLAEGINYFDQRSSNEGFLFLMFYFSLFISADTPASFAIDNIDASLNPKLCSKLISTLSMLANKYDKQVILTTHNPAVLDGLDLSDENQRLFVVYRNKVGHTKTKRVYNPEPSENQSSPLLSDLFMAGSIGGLPKNF